jgi:uncharacterized protein (TIGR03492 family)
MINSKKILVISNGYSENLVGANLISLLLNICPVLNFIVLPLVGEGTAYEKLENLEILQPRKELPSGGFIRKPAALISDLKAGLISLILSQIKTLRKVKKEIDFVVCIGDFYALILVGFFVCNKIIFLPTAKSNYIEKHFFIEKFFIKKYAKAVFTRDELTARSLREFGINSFYFGNVLMDCFKITGDNLEIKRGCPSIVLLPGSRTDAYLNLEDMLESVNIIANMFEKGGKGEINFILAKAPSLNDDRIRHIIYKMTKIPIVISEKFGDTINNADVVIGLSGTANEQAVGMGKPVITFPGRGSQATKKFLEKQARLLGGAAKVVPRNPQIIAREVISVLNDHNIREHARKIGLERMGVCGATRKIASYILDNIT